MKNHKLFILPLVALSVLSCGTHQGDTGADRTVEHILSDMRSDRALAATLDSLAQLSIGPGARWLDAVKYTFSWDGRLWVFNDDWGGVLEIPGGYIPKDDGKYSGMPLNLEGKLTESGLATAMVSDYRNYCHGRFIFTSNHLEDSAVVMLVSPRERDIVERTRKFLPAQTSLVIIETEEDTPEAALDLLVRTTAFFFELCEATGTNHESPSNPGRIDKRVPIWVPFISGMKKNGPLTIR